MRARTDYAALASCTRPTARCEVPQSFPRRMVHLQVWSRSSRCERDVRRWPTRASPQCRFETGCCCSPSARRMSATNASRPSSRMAGPLSELDLRRHRRCVNSRSRIRSGAPGPVRPTSLPTWTSAVLKTRASRRRTHVSRVSPRQSYTLEFPTSSRHVAPCANLPLEANAYAAAPAVAVAAAQRAVVVHRAERARVARDLP